MKLVGATIVSTTLVLLGSLGCGGTQDTPAGSSSGGTGQTSTCANLPCFERCLCETNSSSVDGCVQACRTEGTGNTGGGGASGSGGTVSSGGSTASGGTGPGSGGTGTSTGGTTSTGGSAGVAGTGGTPNTTTHQIIELKMQPFTVPAGAEAFACQNFANPNGANQLVFVETESFMTTGSHHMFVMEGGSNTNGPLETEQTNPQGCNGLQFSTMVHSAQTPQTTLKYPPGVGAKLNGGTGLRMVAHYFNTSTAAVTPDVRVLLYVANPGEVNQLAGFLFGNLINLNVRAGQTGTAHGTATVPYDVSMLFFVSHMHSHATNFVATVNGQTLYQTTEWDAPEPVVFDPMKQIAGGSVIDWTCSYDNTTGTRDLTFGESAKTNEMCIINGRVITPNGVPLTCNAFSSTCNLQ